jgi:hypothetical protein
MKHGMLNMKYAIAAIFFAYLGIFYISIPSRDGRMH